MSQTGSFACDLGRHLTSSEAVTDQALTQIAGRLVRGYPEFSVSRVMHVREEVGSIYNALSRGRVPFHNDLLYFFKPPQYVLLYCDEAAESGGETILVRGDQAFQCMSERLRKIFGARVRIREGDCSIMRSLLAKHPLDGTDIFLFADTRTDEKCIIELNDTRLSPNVLAEVRLLLNSIEPRRQVWKKGDLLIFDNLKILHARTPYTGNRALRRVSVGPFASSL